MRTDSLKTARYPAALAMAVVLMMPGTAAQDQKERFTAFAINMNSGPRTAVVDIVVERWTTDAEREALLVELKEKGPDALLRLLQKMPRAGFIRTPDSLGYEIRFARHNPLDEGGRQIVIGTDRPIGFWEARNMGRSMDYPFTILELRLNDKNEGEGKMLAGTKIIIDKKNNLVLENYGQQPVRLNQIRPLK
jgi:hypothetical protein